MSDASAAVNEPESNSDWLAQAFRLTVFPITPSDYETETWWQDLTGQPPENRISQPQKGTQIEYSQVEIGRLSLELELDRLHWRLNPGDVPAGTKPQLPVLGPLGESVGEFASIAQGWLLHDLTPPLRRLAFGATLFLPVEDLATGYRALDQYLHSVEIDPENMADFKFQVNRPRVLGEIVPTLSINRLSRWSVGSTQVALIRFSSDDLVQFGGESGYACNLELDINTSADFEDEIGKAQSAEIYRILLDMGIEISQDGDVA
ncbi:MAG: hypothetical protein ACC700_19205 [Anaerolineales bacterium]